VSYTFFRWNMNMLPKLVASVPRMVVLSLVSLLAWTSVLTPTGTFTTWITGALWYVLRSLLVWKFSHYYILGQPGPHRASCVTTVYLLWRLSVYMGGIFVKLTVNVFLSVRINIRYFVDMLELCIYGIFPKKYMIYINYNSVKCWFVKKKKKLAS
jgi:hypothetical protein